MDPQIAVMLIKSAELKCVNEAATIAAMLSVPYCFYKPRNEKKERKANKAKEKFVQRESDHFTLLNVFNAFVESNFLILI